MNYRQHNNRNFNNRRNNGNFANRGNYHNRSNNGNKHSNPMTSLYTPTSNDIEELLMNLNKYSLTNKNIIKSFCFVEQQKPSKQTNTSEEVKLTKKKSDYFYPPLECKDTLFWCWASHHYGMQEYELNKNNLYNYETNRKFEYVSIIRNNKLLLKSVKLNRTHLEENLLDDNGIDL